MKRLQLILVLLLSIMVFKGAFAAAGDELLKLPVQDAGRIKPYDTFSKEMLEIVHGKSKFEGRGAAEIVMTWMLSPQSWQTKKIFEVRNHEVLKALGLPAVERYFSGDEIFSSPQFGSLIHDLQSKRETKEKLTPYFQALQRLEDQLSVFREIAGGNMLRLIPPKEGTVWLSVVQFEGEQQTAFAVLTKSFIGYIGGVASHVSASELKQLASEMDSAVLAFREVARKNNPGLYSVDTKVNVEVFYNHFHPFRWAYIFYLLSSLVLLMVWSMNKITWMKAAWAFASV